MAVKNPIGIDASGNLYEMDATDLATKNPICLYSGELKELQSGDSLPGGGGGGGTDPVIHEYTANATWTKPTASNFYGVMVLCVGAGGGGGSGRNGAIDSSASGGGGGAGGCVTHRFISAAQLTNATESITIGAGGLGGASQATTGTNGTAGSIGGDTSFGSTLVLAIGGGGGRGGTRSSGATGVNNSDISCVPSRGPYSRSGANGGLGRPTASGGVGLTGLQGRTGAPGGGGGGGTRNTAVFYAGGRGGSVFDAGTSIAAPFVNSGISDGEAGEDDKANNIMFDIDIATTYGIGTGGGGGGGGGQTGVSVLGQYGGKGGRCAGGGGGGNSWADLSGHGGDGGDGLCIVVEYYGA